MSRRVAIVTDSTASIPTDIADYLGLTVVQLGLTVGEEQNDERRVPHAELARAMRDNVPVATSPPPVPAFYWSFTDAVARGAEAIVSVHLSGALSETCTAAREAAAEFDVPVYVIDSRLCGLGLGYPVMAAAEAADAGATAQGVLNVLDRRLRATTEMLYVDTLEYLLRSGRVSKTQATLGKALSIKPVMVLKEGSLIQLGRAVGPERALKRAVSHARKRAGDQKVDIAVEHFECRDRAEWLVDELRMEIPHVRRCTIEETSAIIGAHAGPGAIGITVSPV